MGEKLRSEKQLNAKKMKEDVIREEILKISENDFLTKKLEKKEKKILQRLKETHMKQKEAIEEIQRIFNLTGQGSLGYEVRNKHNRSLLIDESSIDYQPGSVQVNGKTPLEEDPLYQEMVSPPVETQPIVCTDAEEKILVQDGVL